MILIELLISTVGVAFGKTLLGIWLKEADFTRHTGESILDLLKAKTGDILASRRSAREFETIVDKIGESLEPLFRQSKLDESSCNSIAEEVKDAILAANLTIALLASLSYNPKLLKDYIIQNHRLSEKQFSERELHLYDRSIDLISQYIVDLVPSLPTYAPQSITEILSRFDITTSNLVKIIETLNDLRLKANENNDINDSLSIFERDYRAAVSRRYDRLFIFGADLSRQTRRYQLSVAYVSLEMQKDAFDEDVLDVKIPVEEALSSSRHIAIIGEAGVGKTTLLNWLAVNSAQGTFPSQMNSWQDSIPIYVELRRYKGATLRIEDFLSPILVEISVQMPPKWVEKLLSSGRALLLVDGLDEVIKPNRIKVLDWMESISNSYPATRIIFTSRPGARQWRELVEDLDFEYFNISPMTSEQIRRFISHWYTAILSDTESSNAHCPAAFDLFNKIKTNIHLLKLANNPLLCAMICALHYERHMQLPSDRKSLYEACSAMLIERRDIEREIEIGEFSILSYEQKRVLLDDLAYWMIRNGKTRVNCDEALQRIESRIRNMAGVLSSVSMPDMLAMLIERSGIIREPVPGEIDFLHRTFQEYMAARAISSEGDYGLLLKNANDDQWYEVIVLAIGFANKKTADQFIKKLLEMRRDNDSSFKYDLLAMSCLETAIEVSAGLRAEVEMRIRKLIPPTSEDQIKALISTSELVVPFLGYSCHFTDKQAVACIRILTNIGTTNSLNQLSTYYQIDNRAIQIATNEAAASLPLEEFSDSTLITSIYDRISNVNKTKLLELSGNLISSLLMISSKDFFEKLPHEIKKLRITEFNNHCQAVIPFFSSLQYLELSGNYLDVDEICSLSTLKTLVLAFDRIENHVFNSLQKFINLNQLVIKIKEGEWPRLENIEKSNNIEVLFLLSYFGPPVDFDLFESISNLTNLKYLHIAAASDFDLDVSPLSKLDSLIELEITTFSSLLPEVVIALAELDSLKRIKINLDKKDYDAQIFLRKLKTIAPNTTISFRPHADLRKLWLNQSEECQ